MTSENNETVIQTARKPECEPESKDEVTTMVSDSDSTQSEVDQSESSVDTEEINSVPGQNQGTYSPGKKCRDLGCFGVPEEDYQYCPEHTCIVDYCNLRRTMIDRRLANHPFALSTLYCTEHRCEASTGLCPQRKFVEQGQEGTNETVYRFCQEHLCPFNDELPGFPIREVQCPNERGHSSTSGLAPGCLRHCRQVTRQQEAYYRALDADRRALRMEAQRQYEREWNAYREDCQRLMETAPKITPCLSTETDGSPCKGLAFLPKKFCGKCSCQVEDCEQPTVYESFYCKHHLCESCGCETQASSGSKYCVEHRCQAGTTCEDEERCPNETNGCNWFCNDHICQYEDCERLRESGSFYCASHYNAWE